MKQKTGVQVTNNPEEHLDLAKSAQKSYIWSFVLALSALLLVIGAVFVSLVAGVILGLAACGALVGSYKMYKKGKSRDEELKEISEKNKGQENSLEKTRSKDLELSVSSPFLQDEMIGVAKSPSLSSLRKSSESSKSSVINENDEYYSPIESISVGDITEYQQNFAFQLSSNVNLSEIEDEEVDNNNDDDDIQRFYLDEVLPREVNHSVNMQQNDNHNILDDYNIVIENDELAIQREVPSTPILSTVAGYAMNQVSNVAQYAGIIVQPPQGFNDLPDLGLVSKSNDKKPSPLIYRQDNQVQPLLEDDEQALDIL